MTLERDELYEKNIALQSSCAYANEIQEVLDFKNRYEGYQVAIAHILTRHISRDGHYLLVDAGENKHIKVGMPVVYKNILLGRVAEVWPQYSKVILTTDRACKVAAVCVETNVHGIHEGMNTTQETSLAHVSHLLQLKDNDLIISSGEGLIFPRGFALGTIEHFELAGLHYKVTVRPLLDIHCLDYCSILQKVM